MQTRFRIWPRVTFEPQAEAFSKAINRKCHNPFEIPLLTLEWAWKAFICAYHAPTQSFGRFLPPFSQREYTSYSFSRLIPYLAQNNRTFLSEKPLVTSGKSCVRISLTYLYVLLSSMTFLIKVTLLSIYSAIFVSWLVGQSIQAKQMAPNGWHLSISRIWNGFQI